jgi:hypothetical protein
MSFVQVLSLFGLVSVVKVDSDPRAMVGLLTLSSFAYGVVDTVVDGLWVTQVRCDAKYGSNDLLAYSWIWLSIGGISSSGAYALFGHYGLYWAVYLIPLLASLLLMVSAFFISKDVDGDAQLILDMDLKTRFKFTIKSIKQGLKQRQLQRILIFYLILALMTPNFEDFIDYYLNFGPMKDSFKDSIVFVGILIATVLYELKFTDSRIRNLILVAILTKIINCLLFLLLSLGIQFGLTKY